MDKAKQAFAAAVIRAAHDAAVLRAHGWPVMAADIRAGASVDLWDSGLDRAEIEEILAGEYGGPNVVALRRRR